MGAKPGEIQKQGCPLTELCAPASERAASAVRDQLDRATLAVAWAAGRAMGAEEVVTWAQGAREGR